MACGQAGEARTVVAVACEELFYVTHVTKVSGADVGCLAKEWNSSSRSLWLSWWLVFKEGGSPGVEGKQARRRAPGSGKRPKGGQTGLCGGLVGPLSCAVHARGLGRGGSAWLLRTRQALSCSFPPVTSLLGAARLSKNDLHR